MKNLLYLCNYYFKTKDTVITIYKMDKIKLEVTGLSYSQSQSGAYALILSETNGARRLPIIIGGFEAQAIAIEIERMKPSRPLTHDLFKSLAVAYKLDLTEIIIYKFSEGIFYSRLIVTDGSTEKEIDARTSDAVALAIRFNCPIYTYENILSIAGVSIGNEKTSEHKEPKENIEEKEANDLNNYTSSELEEMLIEAVENEEFEKASQIRDEINRRKKI